MKHNTDLLNSINILEVAEKLNIEFNRNNKALCFIHNEAQPSLSFEPKRNMWYCFGCGVGGNVIKLVQEKNKMSFHDACVWLEKNFNLPSFPGDTQYTFEKKNRPTIHSKVHNDSKKATRPDTELYKAMLEYLELSDRAKDYLCNVRNLSDGVLYKNGIVSIEDSKKFYEWLRKTYSDSRLLEAGLLTEDPYGTYKNHWWMEGIVFPYFNYSGEIINLQIRPYKETKSKYIFLHGQNTCMYNENSLLDLDNGSTVFLCEGAIDVLSLLKKGFCAVGLPGVPTLKKEWISILSRFNIEIVFDNDAAGQRAAEKHKQALREKNINVRIRDISPYKDINEMLVAEG